MRQITTYISDDGRQYPTREAATLRDRRLLIENIFERGRGGQPIYFPDGQDAASWLIENREEIQAALRLYDEAVKMRAWKALEEKP